MAEPTIASSAPLGLRLGGRCGCPHVVSDGHPFSGCFPCSHLVTRKHPQRLRFVLQRWFAVFIGHRALFVPDNPVDHSRVDPVWWSSGDLLEAMSKGVRGL